jgi:aerobic C4-dicarboxylate transport protein
MTQQSDIAAEPPADREPKKQRRDRTHCGHRRSRRRRGRRSGGAHLGSSLGVLGTLFVNLIKMMISPVIFCSIVLGIGSVRKAASVGKVGGLAMA